ncbi:FecR family protein [Maribacter sp. 2210JD10-5]|uniref:FecR family protein n=1 Tax=Maribacter sp. 2210JD10-5 TaxID=3386272 RepID=UPI0039BD1AD1
MDNDNLVQKWLSDELTQEENKSFNTMEDASFYKDIVSDAKHFKASQFSTMPDFDTFKEHRMNSHTPVIKLKWLKPMMRIASILVISLGIYYFTIFEKPTTAKTLLAEKTTIELPDASRVVLNADSEVSYDKDDWANNRTITLKGEAFFDVAKGAKFDVLTEKGTVTVLGTEFNVKQRGDFFQVACYEGTVRVTMGDNTEILHAGDNLSSFNSLINTGKHVVESPQWTNNMSQFTRVPVSEVLSELERQYNITITAKTINKNELFTGGFTHDDMNSALLAVCEPLGLTFEIINKGDVRLSTGE